ncbi:alpha/beta hydrolase [Thiothrix subterranea]|uniref:Alpha/beta hydrolase n=1 Tax=Thiothrix subterranea TaxID=2735563 RepID=A0AA51R3A9_9GAMM|nr:alpha/beta hydrolase [Thiothrix subterranea]MDQ5768190.1 alpha/beta hydrolase [Thiothrix subterranea]QQZ30666.1 alpha/beta hydrolase [Thiothrix subterranea]WML85370.1 alpha/beta hydrolase [Thiothrix subterranea]
MVNLLLSSGAILLLIVVISGLSACTPASIPLKTTQAPPALVQQPLLRTSDGTELVMTHWQAHSTPKATLLLIHGLNEYAGAFDEMCETLAQHGVEVWAYDQRGFGRSPYRGLWSSAERMAHDAREAASQLRQTYPDRPLYVLGFSMGGAVTLLAAAQGKLDADGIILAAPAVWTRATQPFYQRWAHQAALRLTPGWKPTGESLAIRPTDNTVMLRRIWKSPWMIKGTRIDTLNGVVDLMDKAYSAADSLSLPVLLLYGDKDQIIPKKPIERLWQRLPKSGKTRFIRYPQGWHMLGRDLNGDEVIADMVEWMH